MNGKLVVTVVAAALLVVAVSANVHAPQHAVHPPLHKPIHPPPASMGLAPEATYWCFKNTGAVNDFHYVTPNSTDSAGNIVYQGYDHVVGTGDYALTGTYNPIARTYSFNTNQPPYIYINQWSVAADGSWQNGFIYAIVGDPTQMAEPIGFSTFPSTFAKC